MVVLTPLPDLAAYRRRAARHLPRMVMDYVDGAAGEERGLDRNRAAFARTLFVPRRLTDVSRREAGVTLWGRDYPLPLAIAPMGLTGVLRPEGDLMLARAAGQAGIPFCLSTASTSSIEEVARAGDGEKWFQLYVLHRDQARLFVRRALAAGYTTLILTVDVPVNGRRLRDRRSGFKVPFRLTPRIALDAALHPAWTMAQLRHGLPQLASFASAEAADASTQAALLNRQMDAGFDWVALAELRALWPHRLVLKGLTSAAELARAEAAGCDAVILSNHGARQLEDVAAPFDTLRSVQGRTALPLLLDSGIRSGEDVVKALAAGARMCLLGRAALYGLGARGEAGVREVIAMIAAEIDTTLALLGCPKARDLGPEHIQAEAPPATDRPDGLSTQPQRIRA
ncbi:alpha-hydroxy-acid oxidizing protein [Salipiger marinus]|uniref:alpha-hydroxy-acid oxidizing protein n=1 Tax=Salipiger marinus TaxID=555512 RepID=UPI001E5045F6|nr:alpha-hydroxy-acid oxidizing protein [Salipiger manganoxidans]MCD1618743.1 alpha-hydroxy-acid oxidizing protein [Salipiger manganoxidans]MEB3417817.1 alpha-hydroxy-acid oxidizing protein [Salipiger manganoxidans]